MARASRQLALNRIRNRRILFYLILKLCYALAHSTSDTLGNLSLSVILEELIHDNAPPPSPIVLLDEDDKPVLDFEPLDVYWRDKGGVAYELICDGISAGFCLLRAYPNEANLNDVGQFYVSKSFRGRGVGKKAFCLCTEMHPGKWLIRVLTENHGALNFWLGVVSELAMDTFSHSIESDQGLLMHFIRFEID